MYRRKTIHLKHAKRCGFSLPLGEKYLKIIKNKLLILENLTILDTYFTFYGAPIGIFKRLMLVFA
ncbi:hypothetical protein CRG49_003540 [Neisseria sp. N95_16]|nr:hypothetical protein CRG49_003540 [Neisseria sp. N95_16]